MSNDSNNKESMQGMFLTFEIANVGYGIEICHVIEIIGVQEVTKVPNFPSYVIGVINLRGKVIPIIDVRNRFGMEHREYDDRTCIIVVNVGDVLTGMVVDKVSEVVTISPEKIEPAPKTGAESSLYVQGLGKIGDQVLVLLKVAALLDLDASDLEQLDEAV